LPRSMAKSSLCILPFLLASIFFWLPLRAITYPPFPKKAHLHVQVDFLIFFSAMTAHSAYTLLGLLSRQPCKLHRCTYILLPRLPCLGTTTTFSTHLLAHFLLWFGFWNFVCTIRHTIRYLLAVLHLHTDLGITVPARITLFLVAITSSPYYEQR
jgi:hypothetical protein